uniref:FLYWCH-type domain-containing protein n=1 Tax=Anopheles stephensi TaxID=30069 RepID=A0A182Y4G3_ANOST
MHVRAFSLSFALLHFSAIRRILANTFTPAKGFNRTVVVAASRKCTGSSARRGRELKPALNFAAITKTAPVPMSVVPTRKGAAGILCQGHHFEFRYARNQHKVYRCAWHSARRCQAQVLLYDKLFYIISDKHTHSEPAKLDPDILGKTTLKQT